MYVDPSSAPPAVPGFHFCLARFPSDCRQREGVPVGRRAILVSDTQRWRFNCCDHGTDPLLDPPKGRPQNGCHSWIRNGAPKRCPPTVGGHTSGAVKWTSKVDPILRPSNEASFSNFQDECICMRQQDSVQMDQMEAGLCRRPYCV